MCFKDTCHTLSLGLVHIEGMPIEVDRTFGKDTLDHVIRNLLPIYLLAPPSIFANFAPQKSVHVENCDNGYLVFKRRLNLPKTPWAREGFIQNAHENPCAPM